MHSTTCCRPLPPLQKEAKAHKVMLDHLTNKWTVIAIDMSAVAKELSGSPYGGLQSLQFGSTMTVRGAFTSDIKFSFKVSI